MIRQLSWKLLDLPSIYNAFGRLSGGLQFRDFLLNEWLQPKRGESVLDIGCGPAEWLSFFPEVDYTGFDFNPGYIAQARTRYGDRGKFLVASAGDDLKERLGRYDLVIMSGVLHHLTDDECRSVIDLAAAVMKPGGRLVTLDGVVCESQSWLARKIVLSDRGRFIRDAEAYERLLRACFETVESEVYYRKLRIPYTHFATRCRGPKARSGATD